MSLGDQEHMEIFNEQALQDFQRELDRFKHFDIGGLVRVMDHAHMRWMAAGVLLRNMLELENKGQYNEHLYNTNWEEARDMITEHCQNIPSRKRKRRE